MWSYESVFGRFGLICSTCFLLKPLFNPFRQIGEHIAINFQNSDERPPWTSSSVVDRCLWFGSGGMYICHRHNTVNKEATIWNIEFLYRGLITQISRSFPNSHSWEIRCWNAMTLNLHFASFSCLSENLKMTQTAGMLQDFWEKPEVSCYLFIYLFILTLQFWEMSFKQSITYNKSKA